MGDSDRYIVALPAALAVLAFIVWICRLVRKSRRARNQPSTLPSVHVVMVYDKNSAATEADNAYTQMNDGIANQGIGSPVHSSSSEPLHQPPTRQTSNELHRAPPADSSMA